MKVLLEFLPKLLVESMKQGLTGNVVAMFIVSAIMLGFGYVAIENKHSAAMAGIKANHTEISSVKLSHVGTDATMTVMTGALKNIDTTLKEMKDDFKITKRRVWELREQQLKGN